MKAGRVCVCVGGEMTHLPHGQQRGENGEHREEEGGVKLPLPRREAPEPLPVR